VPSVTECRKSRAAGWLGRWQIGAVFSASGNLQFGAVQVATVRHYTSTEWERTVDSAFPQQPGCFEQPGCLLRTGRL
jgi:hypothetical protein